MALDITKPMCLRGYPHRKARVLATDVKAARSLIVAIENSTYESGEIVALRFSDGRDVPSDYKNSPLDVVNEPERVSRFFPAFNTAGGILGMRYNDIACARQAGGRQATNIVEIIFIEGIPVEMKTHFNSG